MAVCFGSVLQYTYCNKQLDPMKPIDILKLAATVELALEIAVVIAAILVVAYALSVLGFRV